jgi:hypothetical protein
MSQAATLYLKITLFNRKAVTDFGFGTEKPLEPKLDISGSKPLQHYR